MIRTLAFTAALLLLTLSLPAATPLTESQRIRLGTADDASPTVDEAAFYALLENVADAPLTKAGSVIPDYAALRKTPADHRGDVVYIEARFITAHEPLELSREGFDGVRAFVVQIANLDKQFAELTADDMALVYLTDPPALSEPQLRMNQYMYDQTGATVTLPARFYKVVAEPTREGKTKTFLAFVGHTAEFTGVETGRMDPAVRNTILFAVGIAALLLYWFWRVATIRRRRSGKATQVEQYRLRRAERQRERDTEDDEAEYDEPDDLPDDPIAAMQALKDKHAADHPPVFTLDDEPDADTDETASRT